MELNIGSRLKNAWNAFQNKSPVSNFPLFQTVNLLFTSLNKICPNTSFVSL